MIPLNKEPLLSFRDRVLRDHDFPQRQAIYRRPKGKATEDGRRKQKDDYETALIRKQQRKEQDIAMRSKHRSEKLDRIEQRFIKSQKMGYARLNEVKVRMKEEQELFHRQRAGLLKDGIFHPTDQDNLLLITIFLSILSPLWLTVVFIYNLYSRARGLYHRA
jgi:hypothetical protein